MSCRASNPRSLCSQLLRVLIRWKDSTSRWVLRVNEGFQLRARDPDLKKQRRYIRPQCHLAMLCALVD